MGVMRNEFCIKFRDGGKDACIRGDDCRRLHSAVEQKALANLERSRGAGNVDPTTLRQRAREMQAKGDGSYTWGKGNKGEKGKKGKK